MFKIVQIINLFDKIRLMNVNLTGLLGKFLIQVGEVFNNNLIEVNDFEIVSKPRLDRFYETKTSVVAYRRKLDKMAFLTFSLLIELSLGLFNWVNPIKSDINLLKL